MVLQSGATPLPRAAHDRWREPGSPGSVARARIAPDGDNALNWCIGGPGPRPPRAAGRSAGVSGAVPVLDRKLHCPDRDPVVTRSATFDDTMANAQEVSRPARDRRGRAGRHAARHLSQPGGGVVLRQVGTSGARTGGPYAVRRSGRAGDRAAQTRSTRGQPFTKREACPAQQRAAEAARATTSVERLGADALLIEIEPLDRFLRINPRRSACRPAGDHAQADPGPRPRDQEPARAAFGGAAQLLDREPSDSTGSGSTRGSSSTRRTG